MKQDSVVKKETNYLDSKVDHSLEQKLEKTSDVEIINLDVSLFKDVIKIKATNDNLESEVDSSKVNTVVPIVANYIRRNVGGEEQGKYGAGLGNETLGSYAFNPKESKYIYLGSNKDNETDKKSHLGRDNESETLTEPEAAAKMQDLQYAQVLGNYHEVSLQDRRKLAMWIAFNPVLFRLFESQSMTRDVDYSRYV